MSKNQNSGFKAFLKKLISVGLVCVITGSAIGLVGGFAVPTVTKYIIPKIENSTSNEDIIEDSNSDEALTEVDANLSSLETASKSMVELIKKVKPAVVCITSVSQAQTFFNQIYETEGSGSGIMFHEDSENVYIATNNHVIEGASKVSIQIEDSELIEAALVGKDANADLAVISIKKADAKAKGVNSVTLANFGNSDQMEIGDTVVAIGNALGMGNTATAGIVSAIQKQVNIQGRTLNVLQTDAAINPGNSGGALINSKGEVIGINTAKFATTEVEGIGYSITSNVATQIIEKLMNKTETPALGVAVSTITEQMANYYNLPQAGVLIESVVSGGSAAEAGIKPYDIITSYNGQPIFTSDQLIEKVQSSKVGATATLKIIRDSETLEINVKLKATEKSF